MTYQFTFNNINVNVDDSKDNPSVWFQDTTYLSNIRKFTLVDFRVNYDRKVITTFFKDEILDTATSLPIRSNINEHTSLENKTGMSYFDIFYSLPASSIGLISTRACINNILERLIPIFGEEIPCFNFFDNYTFYNPIELTAVSTPETVSTLHKTDNNGDLLYFNVNGEEVISPTREIQKTSEDTFSLIYLDQNNQETTFEIRQVQKTNENNEPLFYNELLEEVTTNTGTPVMINDPLGTQNTPVFIDVPNEPVMVDVPQQDGTITATVVNQINGGYEYKLNDGIWQDSNLFTGLSKGDYQISARHKTQQVIKTKTISVA